MVGLPSDVAHQISMYVVSESMFLVSDRVLFEYQFEYILQTLIDRSSSELA